MGQENNERNTQLDGTVPLPDGPKLPVTVMVDWAELEQAGVSVPDPLLLRAVEVFGKAQEALSWLNTANADFDGQTPRSKYALKLFRCLECRRISWSGK